MGMRALRNLAGWSTACLLLVPLLVGCDATAVRPSGRVVVQDEDAQVQVVFNTHDRKRIHHYYAGKRGKLYHKHGHKKGKRTPPGLAKRDKLPPGLEKQLHHNGRLPPGLEGRALPADLEQQLTPLPPGYVRLQVGGNVVLADERTRVVFDVIHDVTL